MLDHIDVDDQVRVEPTLDFEFGERDAWLHWQGLTPLCKWYCHLFYQVQVKPTLNFC